MKYKIGDKVKIRKGLVVGKNYGDNSYSNNMYTIAKCHNYILTIGECSRTNTQYIMIEDVNDFPYYWTEEMIEGLAEPTDREKFEECMRKLCSLDCFNDVWNAFNKCVTSNPENSYYKKNLKIVSDFLFGEKKKMTKAEIEAELGYKIEIVEVGYAENN